MSDPMTEIRRDIFLTMRALHDAEMIVPCARLSQFLNMS
jgi:hypothetical protein